MSELRMRLNHTVSISACLFALISLTGCQSLQPTQNAATAHVLQGSVHGGQQPITGASIQLYAVGTSGDGSASMPLLNNPVTTDTNGNFSLYQDYTCPSDASLIYIVSLGGNPGLGSGASNPQAALMGAIGACNSLTSSSFIDLNELTTVAATSALAPFMVSPSNVGSYTSDAPALAAAFTLANQLANLSNGTVPGTNLPANASVPVSLIDTLADILANCINSSGGVANDSTACGGLLALTTPSGNTYSTNTITALVDLANNPTLNTASLFNLISSTSPYQPQFSLAPPDFSIALLYPSTLTVSPSSLTYSALYLGYNSAPQPVTLTNSSSSAISLNSISIVGAAAADFSQGSNCPPSLAVSASCIVEVYFGPTANGTRNAYLSISSTGSSVGQTAIQTVSLSGTGMGVSASLGTSSLTFTLFGVPQSVTLNNTGNVDLTVSSIGISDSIFTETDNCIGTVAVSSHCTISVTAPNSETGTAVLTVYDNAGTQTLNLTASSYTSPTSLVMAVGLQKIVSSYAGPAMRIQRLSDDAQTDIGFVSSGAVDNSAILSFLGSTSTLGYIVELYDQSGKGNNVTQTTVANAPTVSLSAPTTITAGSTVYITARSVLASDASETATSGPGYWNLPADFAVTLQGTSAVLAYEPDFSAGEVFEEFNLGNSTTQTFDLIRDNQGFYGLIQASNAWLPFGSGYYPRQQPTVVALTTSISAAPQLYIDGVDDPGVSNVSSGTVTGGILLGGPERTDTSYTNFLSFQVFNSTLTAAQVATLSSAAIPRTTPTVNIVADGDSIMEGHCATYGRAALRYAEPSLSQPADITNIAAGGTVTGDKLYNISSPQVDTSHVARLFQFGYAANIYYLDIGTNDIHNNGATGAATWANVQTILNDAVSIGYTTAVATIMHEAGETSAQATEVDNFNALLRAAAGSSPVNQVVDFAANPSLSSPYFGTSYSCDGIHPNDAGYSIMGTILSPALNNLIP